MIRIYMHILYTNTMYDIYLYTYRYACVYMSTFLQSQVLLLAKAAFHRGKMTTHRMVTKAAR